MSTVYLYGFTRPRKVPQRLADQGVQLVCADGRAAIVAPARDSPVEPTRRNLLAHADVVEELHAGGVVLPARFGILLPDHDTAEELLASEEIERLLEVHRDSAELSVKASYGEDILQQVAAGLADEREAYRRAPTLENGIALGEAVAEALADRRAYDAERVRAAVEPLVVDVRAGEPEGENGALSLALLVERGAVERVAGAVERISEELSPPLHFKLVGPLPPYSFVDLDLPVAA